MGGRQGIGISSAAVLDASKENNYKCLKGWLLLMALEDLKKGITGSRKLIAHLKSAIKARGPLWQLLKASCLLKLQGKQRKLYPGLHVIGWQTYKRQNTQHQSAPMSK